ncbi:MAG: polymerase sigma factor RpoE [Labilithrix sp.]|nr:polymerase sigma factor RpoE [Labilithrix sp.]
MDRLASLFEDHAAFVARTLRRLGIPDRDVDDGLQEVFLVAQSKLDTIEVGKERSFLFGIARRRASTLRRSLYRASRRDEKSLEGMESCEQPPDSSERTEQEHARALLDEMLDALPLDLRTVLVLHELEEMESQEIAELLGIPIGTVASRLRRAREKFEIEADRMRARLAVEDER